MFPMPLPQPRRVLARTIALAATALLAAALLAWAPQPTTGWDQSSAEATLWQLTNGDRVNNGLQPLTQQSTLVNLARWRSKDMVDRNYFDHTVLGNGYQVYHWYDTNGLSWVAGGENIGWNNGYSDADSPVKINEGFMNSSGHRANILTPNWTHGGVGAYGADGVMWQGSVRNMRMYTQLFIQLKSAPPPPPPPPAPKPTAKPAPPPPPPAPVSTPHQAPSETPVPATPTPSEAPSNTPDAATIHAYVGNDGPDAQAGPIVASALRVETADAAERGMFEAVIASLLSFFLG
jgi:uncharacterized protein YkwD